MTQNDLSIAREHLNSGDYTCVIRKDDVEYTSLERGVKPLVRWLTEGTDLRGFSAADKVVGKATAYLYCLLGVKEVYAHVMSRAAAQALEENGITPSQGKLVDNIINRQGNGICPFEAAVWDIHTPEEALPAIRAKMEEMHISLF
jgi:hypothetical protein